MHRMLAVKLTKLFLLQPFRSIPFLFFGCIVAVLAFSTFKCDNFSRHNSPSYLA
jgi:hypothetical protein